MDQTGTADQGLVITRIFDAPRKLVFDAWTKPEHMMRWWGPRGFTTPFCTIDLRPGGTIRFCIQAPLELRRSWARRSAELATKPDPPGL